MKLSILAFTLTLLIGCSTMRWDPVVHHVSVESASLEYVEISQIYIHEADKGITIYGELSPRRITQEIPPGHVNIEIISQDGVTTFAASVDIHRIGKIFKSSQRYSFSATIPNTPPEGSTIRVRFEDAP